MVREYVLISEMLQGCFDDLRGLHGQNLQRGEDQGRPQSMAITRAHPGHTQVHNFRLAGGTVGVRAPLRRRPRTITYDTPAAPRRGYENGIPDAGLTEYDSGIGATGPADRRTTLKT